MTGDAQSFIELAKEHGFWGAVMLGAGAIWFALTRRWVVMPGMADLQAENARLRALLDAHGVDPDKEK